MPNPKDKNKDGKLATPLVPKSISNPIRGDIPTYFPTSQPRLKPKPKQQPVITQGEEESLYELMKKKIKGNLTRQNEEELQRKLTNRINSGAQKVTAITQFIPHPLVKYPSMFLNSILSGTDAYNSFQEGDMENAGISVIGALPIPGYTNSTKKALKSLSTLGKVTNAFGTTADLTDNFGNQKEYGYGGKVGGTKEEQEELKKWEESKKKYGEKYGKISRQTKAGNIDLNALDKRMQWVEWANKQLPTGKTPAELAATYAKKVGLNPGDLMASAFEEGVGLRWQGDDQNYSQDYLDNKDKLKGFPIDAFRTYGLDQVGGRVDEFIKKGYLTKDIKKKMKPFMASNEKDEKKWAENNLDLLKKEGYLDKDYKYDYSTIQKVFDAAYNYQDATGKDLVNTLGKSAHTAAFADDESAFAAKAAFIAAERDSLKDYLKKNKLSLTPEEERFFTMSAYNGGAGAAQEMIQDYNKAHKLGKNQFMKERPTVWGQVWNNVIPRMAGSDMFTGENYFNQPTDPIANTTNTPTVTTTTPSVAINTSIMRKKEDQYVLDPKTGDYVKKFAEGGQVGKSMDWSGLVGQVPGLANTIIDLIENSPGGYSKQPTLNASTMKNMVTPYAYGGEIDEDQLAQLQEMADEQGVSLEELIMMLQEGAEYEEGEEGDAEGQEGLADQFEEEEEDGEYAYGGIHIKKKNKGKFNALKKRTGKTTEQLTHSKNPLTRKRAVFAQNAKKWKKKHALGGMSGDTIEVEGGEVVQTPDGEVSKIKGPKHEKGGVDINVPPGTKIFSGRLEIDGESMEKRKLNRIKRIEKVEKLLKQQPGDQILKNTMQRTVMTNQSEEQKDMTLQKVANKIYSDRVPTPKAQWGMTAGDDPNNPIPYPVDNNPYSNYTKGYDPFSDYMYEQGAAGIERYDKSFIPHRVNSLMDTYRGTTEYGFEDTIYNAPSAAKPISAPTEKTGYLDPYLASIIPTPERYSGPYPVGKRPVTPVQTTRPTIPDMEIDAPLGQSRAANVVVPNTPSPKRTLDNYLKNNTGDIIGMAGTAFGAIAPLLNTLNARRATKPYINRFQGYGKNALDDVSAMENLAATTKSGAMTDIDTAANSSYARNAGATSVNTSRALNIATDIGKNKSRQAAQDNFTKQMMSILGQRAQLNNQKDQVVMTGAERRDQAEEAARDNYYSNLGENLSGIGTGMQAIGGNLNISKSNRVNANLLAQLSPYGLMIDDEGNVVNAPKK